MYKIVTAFALALLPLTAAATEPVVWKDAPRAVDQRLPHGLTLVPGSYVISDPTGKTPITENAFSVKIPSTSGHDDYWSGRYAAQLENLGWSAPIAMPASSSSPSIKILTRQSITGTCNEQMMLISLGPHSEEFMKQSTNPIRLEFDLIAFNYKTTGECETKD